MNNDLIRELRDIANGLDEVGQPRFAEVVDGIGLTVLAQAAPMTQEQADMGEQTVDPNAGQTPDMDQGLLTKDPSTITDIEELRKIIKDLQNSNAGKQGVRGLNPPVSIGPNQNGAVNQPRPNLT